MNLENKIQFDYRGQWFIVPNTVVKHYDDDGIRIPTKLILEVRDTIMMLKQYFKVNYPKYKVWITVQKHTLGVNLFEMYISEKDGYSIPTKTFSKIIDYLGDLQTSKFNSQSNSWIHNPTPRTSKGHQILFNIDGWEIENKPKYGTYEWGVNQIKTNNGDIHGVFQNHFTDSVRKRLKNEFGQYATVV